MPTTGRTEVSLYFHIPFCKRKCDYCHFYVIPESEEGKNKLLKGLLIESSLREASLRDKKIVSLYFGGGTPSLFSPERVKLLLDKLRRELSFSDDCEITLEVNPENVTFALMKGYREAGINRVSVGIQSLQTNLLQILGRGHGPEIALEAVKTIHQAGLTNISIDLMYDLPEQTLSDWLYTLEKATSLPITHLSLYNLTIEPHTLFFKNQALLRPQLPNEEVSLKMYQAAQERMESAGLHQYEISAFAKEGYASRHNSGYWTGRPFLGFGPSAFSFWEGKRFRNVANLNKYSRSLEEGIIPIDFEESLEANALRRELLVIELRLFKGVDLSLFQEKRGLLEEGTLKEIDRLLNEGYLSRQGSLLTLSQRGVLFYDMVASELI